MVLVVVVVIAILATISTVAYNGVLDRARTAKAKMNAVGAEKVANSYYAVHGVYPTTLSHFASAPIALPLGTSILLNAGMLSASNGENSVVYKYVLTGSTPAGACIYYWSFVPPGGSLSWDGAPASGQPGRSEPVYLGSANSSNCSADVLKGHGPES